MSAQPTVSIKQILTDVAASTNSALREDTTSWLSTKNKNLNFLIGGRNVIRRALELIGNSQNNASGITKYPLFAVNHIGRRRGKSFGGYYGEAIISGIFIATLSDNQRLTDAKYQDNIEPVLFPIYEEFLNQLSSHPLVVIEGGASAVEHDMDEYPADIAGQTPIKQSEMVFPDYTDVLFIPSLSFTIRQLPISGCIKRIG